MKALICLVMFPLLCLACSHVQASGNLSAAEVNKLFSGATVTCERREYGQPNTGFVNQLNTFVEKSVSRFGADGTFSQRSSGQEKTGKWHVADKGDLCVQVEGKKEHCSPVSREGGTYVRTIRNPKGRKLAEIRYTGFSTAGNP